METLEMELRDMGLEGIKVTTVSGFSPGFTPPLFSALSLFCPYPDGLGKRLEADVHVSHFPLIGLF